MAHTPPPLPSYEIDVPDLQPGVVDQHAISLVAERDES